MWREISDGEKQQFVDEYEAEKVLIDHLTNETKLLMKIFIWNTNFQREYDKNLKAYHSSPAYLTFVSAKNKVKACKFCSFFLLSKPQKNQ